MRHPEILIDELAAVLHDELGGPHTYGMAHELLKHDRRTSHLIGVVTGSREAVFYHASVWSIVLVPFDALGVEGLLTKRVQRLNETRHLEAWLRDRGDEWFVWLHPRYRWLIETSG